MKLCFIVAVIIQISSKTYISVCFFKYQNTINVKFSIYLSPKYIFSITSCNDCIIKIIRFQYIPFVCSLESAVLSLVILIYAETIPTTIIISIIHCDFKAVFSIAVHFNITGRLKHDLICRIHISNKHTVLIIHFQIHCTQSVC